MGVPEGVWLCPRCEATGVTVEAVQQRLAARPPVEAGPVEVDTGTTGRRQVARAGAQAAAAQRLAGRLVERKFKDPATGRGRLYRGMLEFQGPDSGPHYFVAAYHVAGHGPALPAASRRGDASSVSGCRCGVAVAPA